MLTRTQRLAVRTSTILATIAACAFAPALAWAQASPANNVVSVSTSNAAPIDGDVQNMVVKGNRVEVTYKNTGAQTTAIVGELQVRDEHDELVATVMLAESMPVKAGTTVKLRVAMPALAKGRYTMYAVVDFGGAELTAAEAALEVK